MIQTVLNHAKSFIGTKQGDKRHKDLIDQYNAVKPAPAGYLMKYTDSWCAAFLTVIFDKSRVTQHTGRECGVERFIKIFKKKGTWLGRVKPIVGDIIVFDWQNNGWADHIGIVEKVEGSKVTAIEGNTTKSVARRTYSYNDWRIVGYARPKYPHAIKKEEKTAIKIALEVLAGQWGNGQERIDRLKKADYNPTAIQNEVNKLVKGNRIKTKTNEDIAKEVIQGKWSNGEVRKQQLKDAGYDYSIIQKLVNNLI